MDCVSYNNQVNISDNMILERHGHGAGSFTINSECTEVTVFGGGPSPSSVGHTVVLQFGKHLKFHRVIRREVFHQVQQWLPIVLDV